MDPQVAKACAKKLGGFIVRNLRGGLFYRLLRAGMTPVEALDASYLCYPHDDHSFTLEPKTPTMGELGVKKIESWGGSGMRVANDALLAENRKVADKFALGHKSVASARAHFFKS